MKNLFLFFTLSSLFLSLINTQSIFILESAEEKPSSDKNILTFTIQAGINEDINSNIIFQIESEFYENDKYIKDKRIECTIPKTSDVSFGTKINIKCSIDLYYIDCLKSNKVKFIKFIKDDNLEISDQKQNVLGNNLLFEKRLKEKEKEKEKENKVEDIKADYEFTADKITYVQYNGNKLVFLIKGQYDSIFTPSFDFDLILNRNIKAKCKSPGLFLTKEGSINCTLIIDPYGNNILDSIKNGIEIRENLYRIQRSFNDDKVFKFSIRDGDKLEIKEFNLNKEQIFREKDEDEDKKSEWEIQREIEKRKREKEREDEKKKKDQEELENLLKRRQQIEKEQNKNNNYNPFYTPSEYDKNKNNNNNNFNYPNNYNNYNNNNNNNFFKNQNDENEQIDYNSNVKLIHLQVRYSYDIIYYMFYALTPVPLGHKIKVGFTISTGGYNYGEFNKINKNIILKAGESITPDDKSIIVEYYARFECPQCKKLVLDKNNIYGAKVYNIPNDEYLLDAVNINQMGNYLQKNKMENPPLYISENIFNQNCMLELAGNFFNKNKFFISKFPLTLIGTGYYNSNKNITVFCNLNEREVFSCPIQESINNFEFKIEQFIINKKDNIIIDNSKLAKDRMSFHASCQSYNNYGMGGANYGGNNPITNPSQNDLVKNAEQMPDILIKKRTNWKKIFLIIASLVVSYYIITKCCCKKEEEENEEYNNSRWRVSSSSYGGGETYGLRSRGW